MELHNLIEKFLEIYGGTREGIRIFSSPGRVNLIGEHTDYNGGYVFPAALTMSSTVVARPRKDRQIKLIATDLGKMVKASLDNLESYKNLHWGNYQLGVANELKKEGYEIIGCDLMYHDTVPLKSGLSSSAAIEVVTALALTSISTGKTDDEIDMIKMAVIGQRAENNFVGVNCGIMDQFASAMGKKNHAIFLDTKDLSFELVPLKLDGMKIVLTNTNKGRSLTESKYNERRSQCERGLEIFKQALPEASCLGEITRKQFEKNKHLIKDETIRNRTAHVIYEDDRVLKSVEALKGGNIKLFGEYMVESHNSLRDLYEVTGVELDTLVEEALKIDGVIGSRMTGAGFGGCTVSIVKDESVERFTQVVGENYQSSTGLEPTFYVSEIGDGGREIKGGF